MLSCCPAIPHSNICPFQIDSISEALINTIRELQGLSSLRGFSLGGGTGLTLRYTHRQSVDIDLFCSEIIGKAGYEQIVQEVKVSTVPFKPWIRY